MFRKTNPKLLLYLIFFASGISGLVYEVVWARMLNVVFGSTVYATTTILVAYMGGLSIGSYFGGRKVDNVKNSLSFYAFCELFIGAFALVFPFLLSFTTNLYISIYHTLELSRAIFVFIRFIMVISVLLIPTTLMGMTLPAISKSLVNSKDKAGFYTGLLYAFNTLGAVGGVIFSAYFGIEKFGLNVTTYIAAFINILIFIYVYIFFKMTYVKYAGPEIKNKVQKTIEGIKNISQNSDATIAVIAYAISGFCALSLEILWTRELVFLIGMDTYAFGTILSIFLLGIGIGSLLITQTIQKIKNLVVTLAILEFGIGFATLLNFILIPHLYVYKQNFYAGTGASVFGFVLSGFLITIFLMIIPTILMGAVFPIAVQLYIGKKRRVGSGVGTIYSLNTLGSILGSLITGFLLIPLIGVINSFKVIVFINILLGIGILWFSTKAKNYLKYLSFIFPIFLVLIFIKIPINKALVMYSYIMKNPKNKLLYYSEDAYAAVSVVDIVNTGRRLYVDSGLAADTSRFDMPSHKLIVHVPLLIQKNPKNALVIGFGMGETSYSITTYGVKVDAVEISKGEIKANKYFYDVNHHILNNPLLNLTIDDGRNYLLTHNKKYDLISVGIIHPGISANSASFYGEDFYKQCLSRLTSNGIISQWVPTHGLSLKAFKVIIKTFVDVFPYSTMWFKYTDNFVILLGSKRPFKIDYNNYINKFKNPKIFNDLKTVGMTDPLVLLDSLWMDQEGLKKYSSGSDITITSDNNPVLEFLAARSIRENGLKIIESISNLHVKANEFLTDIGPARKKEIVKRLNIIRKATEHIVQGHIYKKKNMLDKSVDEFEIALGIYPSDANANFLLKHTSKILYNKLLVEAENFYKTNKIDNAIEIYKKAIAIEPDNAIAYNFMGICYLKKRDARNAFFSFLSAIHNDPNNYEYHFNLASLFAMTGHYEESRIELEKTLKLNPDFDNAKKALAQINKILNR